MFAEVQNSKTVIGYGPFIPQSPTVRKLSRKSRSSILAGGNFKLTCMCMGLIKIPKNVTKSLIIIQDDFLQFSNSSNYPAPKLVTSKTHSLTIWSFRSISSCSSTVVASLNQKVKGNSNWFEFLPADIIRKKTSFSYNSTWIDSKLCLTCPTQRSIYFSKC